MNGYVAVYNGVKKDVWAKDLYDAKKKAIDAFGVRKSKWSMISVMLAVKDDKPVIHAPMF